MTRCCPRDDGIVLFEVLLLERDGIVEEKPWSDFENIGDGIPGEVPMKRA